MPLTDTLLKDLRVKQLNIYPEKFLKTLHSRFLQLLSKKELLFELTNFWQYVTD